MSEKTEPSQQRVILPRAEWKAFIDDVRKLIRADEELLNAYHRLLKAYDQLSEAYGQLSEKEIPEKQAPRGRGLFGRKQATASKRSCKYCGSDLDPKDKSCPTCGKNIDSIPEPQEQPKHD